MGALKWENIVHQHQGWRLLTCIWLHAGIIHLLLNMTCLIYISIRIEQQFGFRKIFLLSYEILILLISVTLPNIFTCPTYDSENWIDIPIVWI